MERREHYRALINKYCNFGVRLIALLIVVNLIIATIFQGRSLPDGTIRLMILDGMFIIAWIMNSRNTKISAQLYISGIYIAFLIYPISSLFNSKPAEDLFLYILVTLVLNSLIVVLIESDSKRLILFWFLLVNVTFAYGLRITIQQLDATHYGPIKQVFTDVPILNVVFPMVYIFICLVTRKFKTEQEKVQKQLEIVSARLSQEKANLEDQNDQVTNTIEALKDSESALTEINSTLEDRISARLQEFDDLNERILNHGFLNSIAIQSSFEKIFLNNSKKKNSNEHALYEHYHQVTNELDEIVNSISKNLHIADTKLNE